MILGEEAAIPEEPNLSPVDQLKRKLGIDEADLGLLNQAALDMASDELGFSAKEYATVQVHVEKCRLASKNGVVDGTSSLTAHLEKELRLKTQPWRSTLQAIDDALSVMGQATMLQLQGEFAENAKAGLISPVDAVLLQALLFWDDETRKKFAAATLRYSGTPRTQLFNVLAARAGCTVAESELFLSERGASVIELPLPLWPRKPAFAALTTQLFAESIKGGEAKTRVKQSTDKGFATKTVAQAWPTTDDKVSGAGALPVQQMHDGTWAVDTAPIESVLERTNAALKRQVQALERRVVDLGGEVRNRGQSRGRGSYGRGRGPAYGATGMQGGGPPAYDHRHTTTAPTPAPAPALPPFPPQPFFVKN